MAIISVLRGLVGTVSLLAATWACAAPMVVLVGLDGFRADYLSRGHAPVLAQMAQTGAVSEGLIPSFPSLTFPNHVTLVTGRLTQKHGIVTTTCPTHRTRRSAFGSLIERR